MSGSWLCWGILFSEGISAARDGGQRGGRRRQELVHNPAQFHCVNRRNLLSINGLDARNCSLHPLIHRAP